MFSRKNFTWKKWLALTAYMFVVTLLLSWLLSLLLKEPSDTRSQFFTCTSLAGRLMGALMSGTLMSFMRINRKS